eukprot:3559085-Prymnesium_polylepis.1
MEGGGEEADDDEEVEVVLVTNPGANQDAEVRTWGPSQPTRRGRASVWPPYILRACHTDAAHQPPRSQHTSSGFCMELAPTRVSLPYHMCYRPHTSE